MSSSTKNRFNNPDTKFQDYIDKWNVYLLRNPFTQTPDYFQTSTPIVMRTFPEGSLGFSSLKKFRIQESLKISDIYPDRQLN